MLSFASITMGSYLPPSTAPNLTETDSFLVNGVLRVIVRNPSFLLAASTLQEDKNWDFYEFLLRILKG